MNLITRLNSLKKSYKQLPGVELTLKNRIIALSTNGERKSLQIEESRLVDKIVIEQKFGILQGQGAGSVQANLENVCS